MSDLFRASIPWIPDRPETLVVCCSDGRWHSQIVEFVQTEISDRADLYAVPGGPAVLDGWNSSFDEARVFEQSMRLFAEYHDLSAVWLIAHQGCAWYQVRHPHLDAAAVERRQLEDLRRGREVLLERHPAYDVRLVLAAHDKDGVIFRDCTREALEAER